MNACYDIPVISTWLLPRHPSETYFLHTSYTHDDLMEYHKDTVFSYHYRSIYKEFLEQLIAGVVGTTVETLRNEPMS